MTPQASNRICTSFSRSSSSNTLNNIELERASFSTGISPPGAIRGVCLKGEGVEKDKVEARKRLENAAAQGDICASDFLKEIK